MLRVVERTLGEGVVHRDGSPRARVGYELTLYRKWVDEGGTLVPRHFEVEGHFMAAPGTLDPLMGTASPLTVHLDDGRRVDLYLVNADGVVTSADERGFYGPPAAG